MLSACSVSDLPFVYQQEFQQGTVLEAADVKRLEMGMSRRQVRFLIGSPDIVDPFNSNRWDYVYRYRPSSKGSGEPEQRSLTVFFDGDRLVGAQGDFVPTDSKLHAGADSYLNRPRDSSG
jgi:outer membrane protein assembly factor BamE